MGSANDVKLIGAWASPYVIRPRIALNVKSVEYEFLEEMFGSKSELLLKSNPVHKKVPVLIHGGTPICESLIIVEYIDETWSSGPSLLPSDPLERASARFWAAYLGEKWFPMIKGIGAAVEIEKKQALIEQVKEGLLLIEEVYAKSSKGKAFFGGDHIGYLDISFGCFLGWLRATEKMGGVSLIDDTKTPGLFKWADKFSSDPAVKPVLPEADKLVEFAKVVIPRIRAAAAAEAAAK